MRHVCPQFAQHLAFCARHPHSSFSFYPSLPPSLYVSIAMSSTAGLCSAAIPSWLGGAFHTWVRDKQAMGLRREFLEDLMTLKRLGALDQARRVIEIGSQQLGDSFLASTDLLDLTTKLSVDPGAARI